MNVPADQSEYLGTGIDALNVLLGGQGLRRGSVVLIRGAPGTGKTTLGLQIARHAFCEEGHHFVFLSVEERADVLLDHITESFWKESFQNHLGEGFEARDLADFWRELLTEAKGDEELLRGLSLPTALAYLWEWLGLSEEGEAPEQPVLFIVDSLTALVDGIRLRFGLEPARQVLLALLESFGERRQIRSRRLTTLFIVEETPDRTGLSAESYIADTVIHLAREPMATPIPISPQVARDWKQDLLFCQILKGRGLPIQRRSCCYEFVERVGVKFYPTYAAQGLVSLFYENQPQLDVIQNIRTVDVPFSYPGVIVQEFTLPALQNMFAVRRHSGLIPLRHPMLLSNVDAYWVDVLKDAKLLHPIPRSKLRLFSLPVAPEVADRPTGHTASANVLGTSRHTQVIEELARERQAAYYEGGDRDCYFAVPQMANVSLLVYRKDVLDSIGKMPPRTWEELEEICELLRPDMPRPYKLLLETQTYDTLLITALELGWGHGAFWHTEGEASDGQEGEGADKPLRIVFERDGDYQSSFNDFVAAMVRLHDLIYGKGIVPPGSSVDPAHYRAVDWVFARHWYSTWIDVLTKTDDKGERAVVFPEGATFGIAELPVSASYSERCNGRVEHRSSWGEWYLAIQKGSENVELGIDLINNLMTSRKVTERARSGAALPTAEKFYEISGENICFGTDLTYNEIRQRFFRTARSRSRFTGYYRIAGVLSGALRAIISNPLLGMKRKEKEDRVRQLIFDAFEEIDPSGSWK